MDFKARLGCLGLAVWQWHGWAVLLVIKIKKMMFLNLILFMEVKNDN
jgi:hypothetical protein